MTFTYLSLFSGIGGMDLGLDRAGMTCVGQVEINDWCRAVLSKHWPEVARHDDVRTAPGWWLDRGPLAVDLVCGGFPCQPFSEAGQRRGAADERWGWPWMLDVVRAARPRYVLVENVPGLLADRDAFGTILADLAGLGFDARWGVLSACAMGAPHARERLFLLAHPPGLGRLQHGRVERGTEGEAERRLHHWATQPEPHRVVDGIPRRVDRNRGLGNAVVPQVAEFIGRQILAIAPRRQPAYGMEGEICAVCQDWWPCAAAELVGA